MINFERTQNKLFYNKIFNVLKNTSQHSTKRKFELNMMKTFELRAQCFKTRISLIVN